MLRLPPPVDAGDLFDIDYLTEPGLTAFERGLSDAAKTLIPNRPMKISEWAKKNIRLAGGTSPRGGRFNPRRYQVDLLDVQQEHGINVIALMGVPRIGKTTIPLVAGSYYNTWEGDDVLFVEVSKESLQVYHDSMLFPTMEVSPAFEGMVRTGQRNGGTEDKWHDRIYTNGAAWRGRSAEVGRAFRQIKARRVYLSEVGDPVWAPGPEGDKIDAALKRTQNYPDGRAFLESSPTDEETCVITSWWKKSDQRKFQVPCPHCGVFQELLPKVGDKDGAGLKYAVDAETGRVIDEWYQCGNCEEQIREADKAAIIDQGYWLATKTPEVPGVAGFHLWAIHSFDERSSWRRIAEAHLEQIHDPSKRQTFKNLWLGLPWQKADMGAISLDVLEQRAEPYPAVVPDAVILITGGGDGQKGTNIEKEAGGKPARHEWKVVGWGYGEESWVLDHIVLAEGYDPYTMPANAEMIALLNKDWVKRDGTRLRIAGACTDVNYNMNEGLDFLNSAEVKKIAHLANGQNLWGVVGKNEARGSRTKLTSLQRVARSKGRTYLQLGTQAGKDTLERRKKLTGSGPEVIHWPESMLKTKGTMYDWFKSFSAIVQRKIKGTNKTYWDDKPGNEAIDCWVYAYAALQLLKEKYPNIRKALATPPAEPPQPYEGIDMSHRSDANEAGTLVIDDRAGAGKAKLMDVMGMPPVPDQPIAPAAAPQPDPELTPTQKQGRGLAMKGGTSSGGLQMGSSGRLRFNGGGGRRGF